MLLTKCSDDDEYNGVSIYSINIKVGMKWYYITHYKNIIVNEYTGKIVEAIDTNYQYFVEVEKETILFNKKAFKLIDNFPRAYREIYWLQSKSNLTEYQYYDFNIFTGWIPQVLLKFPIQEDAEWAVNDLYTAKVPILEPIFLLAILCLR
jgi:hypothetical protein